MLFRALLVCAGAVSAAMAAEAGRSYGLVDAKVFAGPNEREARTVDEGFVPRASSAGEFAGVFARLAGEIARAKTLTVFEGHPRMQNTAEAIAERTKKPSFSRVGQWFYATPLAASEDVERKLRRAVLDGARWGGGPGGIKLCGGFHADFLLRWEGPAGTTEALVCFGCHEVKIVGTGGALYGDLADAQLKEVRAVLKTLLGTELAAATASQTKP